MNNTTPAPPSPWGDPKQSKVAPPVIVPHRDRNTFGERQRERETYADRNRDRDGYAERETFAERDDRDRDSHVARDRDNDQPERDYERESYTDRARERDRSPVRDSYREGYMERDRDGVDVWDGQMPRGQDVDEDEEPWDLTEEEEDKLLPPDKIEELKQVQKRSDLLFCHLVCF